MIFAKLRLLVNICASMFVCIDYENKIEKDYEQSIC
jgi:hypothetical protein